MNITYTILGTPEPLQNTGKPDPDPLTKGKDPQHCYKVKQTDFPMNDANGVILRPRRQVCMPLPIAPHRNLRIPIILRQYAGA